MTARLVKKRGARRPPARGSPQYLTIGRVLRPHGVRGELRLEIHTDSPTHLSDVDTVYIGESFEPHKLLGCRLHKGVLLIKVAGCNTREAADALRDRHVSVRLEAAAPLKEGEYYHHQILGLNVVTDAGEALGQVSEIITTGANDVYVVKGARGEVLLPAIRSVILAITPPTMTVHLPEGLI